MAAPRSLVLLALLLCSAVLVSVRGARTGGLVSEIASSRATEEDAEEPTPPKWPVTYTVRILNASLPVKLHVTLAGHFARRSASPCHCRTCT